MRPHPGYHRRRHVRLAIETQAHAQRKAMQQMAVSFAEHQAHLSRQIDQQHSQALADAEASTGQAHLVRITH